MNSLSLIHTHGRKEDTDGTLFVNDLRYCYADKITADNISNLQQRCWAKM